MADRSTHGAAPRSVAWGAVLLGVAGLAFVVALLATGGRPEPAPAGLPDPGRLVEWALPLNRLLVDLSAVGTVGLLLAAAVLLPSTLDLLSTSAVRAARLAAGTAAVWSLGSLALVVLTYADIAGLPLARALDLVQLWSYATDLPTGRAWAVTAVLAAAVAVTAGWSERPFGAWAALVVALAATLPAALIGHTASAGAHDIAVSSLVVHLVGVVTWVGGLVGLVWYARTDGRHLALASTRYSSLALWAYVAVGVSGVVNAFIRLPERADLWTSGYGALVLVKAVAFAGLGSVGWWHRRHTLPRLAVGEPGAFRRFAAVEALVMAAVVGVAVALARTPTPAPDVPRLPTPAETLLGFPVPDAPHLWDYLLAWRLDALVALTLLMAAVLYAHAARGLRRRGDRWPVGRTIGWYSGLTVAAFATLSGLATYGRVMFSIHMTQHMLLGMVVPLLLVTGAPITLALRALPPAGANRPAGPREWLLAVLHSRVVRVLTNPVVALVLFVTAPYMVYFSDLFEVAMRQHWAHTAMHVHFVLAGYLFYESLVGTDPLPNRAPYPMRLIVLFASMPFHAFFAVALMSTNTVIAASYYATLARPWSTDLLADQTGGAAFAWAFGELPALAAMVMLLVQWSRDDTRRARRQDRQAERDGDAELVAYNEQLRRLGRPGPR